VSTYNFNFSGVVLSHGTNPVAAGGIWHGDGTMTHMWCCLACGGIPLHPNAPPVKDFVDDDDDNDDCGLVLLSSSPPPNGSGSSGLGPSSEEDDSNHANACILLFFLKGMARTNQPSLVKLLQYY